jgi:hypothetical protein
MDKRASLVIIAALFALAGGCDNRRAEEPGDRAADCGAVRDLGARSLKKWTDLGEASPAADAPLAETATHTAELARTAKDIGAAFKKSAPKRTDLAEAAEGARMLGDLAGKTLDAYAGTLRELDTILPALGKLEGAANEAASSSLGDEVLASVGCAAKARTGDAGPPPKPSSKECGAVADVMTELERPAAPAGFVQAAQASRGRAEGLDALVKAVIALPPAPPKQTARDDEARRAREGAEAFRALAKALDAAAPLQERLGREREQAEEAAARFTAELQAASKLCPPAGAGSAAPTGSASAGAAPARSAAPSTPAASAR